MKPNLHQIFKETRELEPSAELPGLILARIKKLQHQQVKRKLTWVYVSIIGSLVAFVGAIFEFGYSFLQSDFWVLLRLLLTDASSVLKNWNDFLFSLLETFPAMSATLILIPIFAILLSFSAYFKLINRSQYNYI